MAKTSVGLILTAALGAAVWGCEAGNTNNPGGAAGSSNTGATGTGGNTGGNTGGGTGAGEIGGFGVGGNTTTSSGVGGMACAGETVKGELVPLDMYIMLDKSGSMLDKTGAAGNGPTKWDAVTTALKSFFADSGSTGLGVGIEFFPTALPGVPDTCTSSAQCGAGGPCLLNACDFELQLGSIAPCDTSADCGFFSQCIPLGQCQNDTNYVCAYQVPEVDCGVDPNGVNLGKCKPMVESFCVNQDSCAAADYASPAVEVATLNGAAAALSAAIDAKSPGGATPTAPALSGAINHAKSWAQAHPDHKVVAVLATDGLPTECDPTDIPSIAGIAQAGKNGNPSILTFVIGVFGAADVGAQQNLDTIAQSGGTGSAFFITDNQDVTQAFLDALHAIQGQTLACDYQIPAPPDGSDLDYGKVNVEYTPSGQNMPKTVFYVTNEAGCDPMLGGWYYDKDPQSGQVPTKILMCPATCAELKGSGGQIDIKIGCQTVVPEPK
ncbi:MAG: VWA domain-containing protein [Polyangiaceae bacterium]|nr:VWA domain-containing protein [Polyangiaceae bacterium]